MSENPYKKSIILALILFVPLVIVVVGGIISRHQATVALREAEQRTFIRWFGTEIACDAHGEELADRAREIELDPLVVLGSPCINNTISYAMAWEENGLLGLGILEQGQVVAVLDSDEFSELSETVQLDIDKLLMGGFPIIKESEFDADRFLIAISFINFILDDLDIDVNIRRSWNDLIEGN